MCGIVGIYSLDGRPVGDATLLRRMAREMWHRGPDDSGVFCSGPVGLAMQRLSIIDVDGGHQPLTPEGGEVTIVFNGEVFNYRELRRDLEAQGLQFTTHSDTEVVARLFEEEGTAGLAKLNGMFAFAVWNARHRTLHVVRDRLGVKPLYYTVFRGNLLFASEIKALLAYPGFPRLPDPVALDDYLSFRYVPAPRTMLAAVRKLLPGHLLSVRAGSVQIEKYWDVDPVREDRRLPEEWGEELSGLLEDSVRLRMISDVPLGAFLSGGIDSSLIVALMQRYSPGPVQTFSIGLEGELDESAQARAVARMLGTEHHERHVDVPDAVLMPRLLWHLDEPLADPAVLPTYALARFARQHVKVALSGEGADELFAGYSKYRKDAWVRLYRRLPRLLRERVTDRLLPLVLAGGHENHRLFFLDDVHRRLAWDEVVLPSCKERLYAPPLQAILRDRQPESRWWDSEWLTDADALLAMLVTDIRSSLADDLLMKVDKMTMAASLEARTPYLDYRVVQLACRIPPHLKLSHGQDKVILRRIARELVPDRVAQRPKHGFSVPIARWFRGELGSRLQHLVETDTSGWLLPSGISAMLDEHRAGRRDFSRELWAVLCFELWHRTIIERREAQFEDVQAA